MVCMISSMSVFLFSFLGSTSSTIISDFLAISLEYRCGMYHLRKEQERLHVLAEDMADKDYKVITDCSDVMWCWKES